MIGNAAEAAFGYRYICFNQAFDFRTPDPIVLVSHPGLRFVRYLIEAIPEDIREHLKTDVYTLIVPANNGAPQPDVVKAIAKGSNTINKIRGEIQSRTSCGGRLRCRT